MPLPAILVSGGHRFARTKVVVNAHYAGCVMGDTRRAMRRLTRCVAGQSYYPLIRSDMDVLAFGELVIVQFQLNLGRDVGVLDRGLSSLPSITNSVAGGVTGIFHGLCGALSERGSS